MPGKIEYISVRPERRAPVVARERVLVDINSGLEGDHPTSGDRQVTIISKEQMEEVRLRLGADKFDPSSSRRNILISGIDFDQMDNAQIAIGEVLLEVTGYCHPCKRMDEVYGDGGRLAMSRKGGYTTKVLRGGEIAVGDEVRIATVAEVDQKSSL